MPRSVCVTSAAPRGVAVTVLRIPGIYALDRAGGDPRERVARGTPVLAAADDVYTSHIHADDLARACVAALHRGRPQRAVNVADDSDLKMGDYFDLVADRFGHGAAAAARARRRRGRALADADELSRRVEAARQCAPEGGAAPGAALPDRRRGPRARAPSATRE